MADRNKKFAILASRKVASNTKEIGSILEKAFGRLGCEGCNSGFDWSIIDIRSKYEVAKTLEGVDEIFVAGKGGAIKTLDEALVF